MGSWEQTAQERSKWRGLISKGAALYEKKKRKSVKLKESAENAKPMPVPTDSVTLTCSACNRQFTARIGLVTHQRTHQHTRNNIQEIMMIFLINERRTTTLKYYAILHVHTLTFVDIFYLLFRSDFRILIWKMVNKKTSWK